VTETPQLDAPLTVGAQLEVRATHPDIADRTILKQHDRSWSYRQYRDESVRTAHFLLERLGKLDDKRPGHVAMLLENHLELLSLYAGCAYSGLTLFGVNTGLRGETLSGVLEQSRARMLVVDERLLPEVERVRNKLGWIPDENLLVVPTQGGHGLDPARNLTACIEAETAAGSLEPPDVDVKPEQPLMVIYTSGTTGLPKGILNNHLKLVFIGRAVSGNMELTPDDCGYACMPLFHSNAMFLGFMPALTACGSMGLRERFSASSFLPDVLRYGVTFWNYVGEPVHYILGALEREFGSEERVLAEVARNPENRLRYAIGNGAAAPDIDRFSDWMGLEDMFELYGSTEAAISTFRRKGDPRGSVGEVTDENVKILREDGSEASPAELDADGKITNYADAVGEICRVAPDTGLFQGYFDNREANSDKYRDGVYHSGDLGHMLERDDKRYLYFDGRTDDWIRKDGENFSAAQVARQISEHPDIPLAAAYGVPCSVSDELVMAAVKLKEGTRFDPKAFFDYMSEQTEHGSMDPKWFPDFVRVVDEFEYTQTEKVLVRNLKRVHFDLARLPEGTEIYWRRRGDETYQPFSSASYQELRREFEAAEKLDLLDR
jgi:fatty-acyl-CoA synthase